MNSAQPPPWHSCDKPTERLRARRGTIGPEANEGLTMSTRGRITGSYGIDAPYVPVAFGLATIAAVVLGVVLSESLWAWWIVALLFLAQLGIYLNTTLRGKFEVWGSILDDLNLTGAERTLDVGCGRGMVVIETARRLTTGHATGIDLWRSKDQSGNDREEARANTKLNEVSGKISLDTGDMAELPYRDNSFDLVTANVAIQNLKERERRRQAIQEILRVTAPGGRIRIVDIQYVGQYRDDLEALGADNTKVSGLGPRAWYGNPFFASELVSTELAS